MPASRRIKELFDGIEQDNLASKSDILRMFTLARELAESRKMLNDLPTLKLFADWILHSELNRRNAKNILSDITSIVEKYWNTDTSGLAREISSTLSMSKLRLELEELFHSEGLKVFILQEPDPWHQCVTWLTMDLLDKPLIGSKFTDEEVRTGKGTTPRVLSLVSEPGEGNQVYWQIALGPRLNLKGLFLRV